MNEIYAVKGRGKGSPLTIFLDCVCPTADPIAGFEQQDGVVLTAWVSQMKRDCRREGGPRKTHSA